MQPLTRRYCSHLRGGTFSISRSTTRQSLIPSLLNNFYHPLSVWLVRRNHDVTHAPRASQSQNANADAIVVGGGAAGIAVVGNLLQAIPRGKIVWIDRSFDGGSIGQLYREIPSYSPAGDFLQYAQALTIFQDICDAAPKPNVIAALQELDPEMTCPLNYAADMLTLISDGLIQHPRVEPVLGTATHAVRNPKTRHWQTTLTPNHDIGSLPTNHNHNHNPQILQHTAPLLVYTTGTRPRTTDLPLPLSRLTLDTCLSPTRLARLLPADHPCTVAVIGDGHAAVLVLRNLMGLVGLAGMGEVGIGGLAGGSHPLVRVRWFTRERGSKSGVGGGVGGSAFVGLQGEAARFAQSTLEEEQLVESGAGEFITRFVIPPLGKGISEMERAVREAEAIKKDLEGVDYVVQDAGSRRTRLPEVRPGLGVLGGPVGKAKNLVFNGSTGSFYPNGASREKVLGLFGAGSAFPVGQRSAGQPVVGVWSFMQSLQKMVPRWVLATKKGRFPRMEDWDRERFGGRAHEYY